MNNRIFIIANGLMLTLKKTGEEVPKNEPVFILRARDCKALGTIRVYQSLFPPTSEHWKTIQAVIDDFMKYRKKNYNKMGDPEKVY